MAAMRVALLMGGRSGEYAVSLASGRAVASALDRLGHARLNVVFGREGGARWGGPNAESIDGTIGEALAALEAWRPDVAFIAMHGPDGEDGRLQGALDLLGVPYPGSGVAGSAVAMNKIRAKRLFRAAGLPVARDQVVTRPRGGQRADWCMVADELGLPLVLKTAQSGSSVGVEVTSDLPSLIERGEALLAWTDAVLVEAWLGGRELTCAVLDDLDGVPRALPLIEIRPKGACFFDYATKYDPTAVDELCPAPVDEALAVEIAHLTLDAHAVLGCRDLSRTDFRLDADGHPVLLETNTLPGLTEASLLPKAARASGLDFDALIARLLALARGRPPGS